MLRKRLTFVPDDLNELPAELKTATDNIRGAYAGFESLAVAILDRFGVDLHGAYKDFLARRLHRDIASLKREIRKIDAVSQRTPSDIKDRWQLVTLLATLSAIAKGHQEIEVSFDHLKCGEFQKLSAAIAGVGVQFGRLLMIKELCDAGVFDRFGSVQSSLAGARKGGTRSGEARRSQSSVPTPDDLRLQRQQLISIGKPARSVSSMLAKKYGCTTDHIRKQLKRD